MAEGFPKRVTIYVHGNDETMWGVALSLGFVEDSQEHRLARHAADEFAIELEFQADGHAKVVSIDGRKVE